MKLQNLSAFILFATINAFGPPKPECAEMVKSFHPGKCCNFPHSFFPEDISKECGTKCKERTEDMMNCYASCFEEKHPLYADGKILRNNTLQQFYPSMNHRNLSRAVWQPVLDNSIDACEKLEPMTVEVTLGNETLKSPATAVVGCIMQMNFLNCPAPAYNASEECEAMKTSIKTADKCGNKIGDTFIIDVNLFYT